LLFARFTGYLWFYVNTRFAICIILINSNYDLNVSSMATATATVAPTMGLLPIPIRPHHFFAGVVGRA